MTGWTQAGQGDPTVAIDCLLETIDLLEKKTEGGARDGWREDDLAGFVRTYIRQISDGDSFVRDLAQLKPILLGGDPHLLTRSELSIFRELLVSGREKVATLKPYWQYYFFKRDKSSELQSEELRAASEALQGFWQHVRTRVDRATPLNYTPTQTLAFLNVLWRFGIRKDHVKAVAPLAVEAKAVFVGGAREMIQPQEWPRVVEAISLIWPLSFQLKAHFFGLDSSRLEREFADSNSLREKALLFGDVVRLLERAVRSQDEMRISRLRIDEIFDQLERLKASPLGVPAEVWKGYTPVILGKLLGGSPAGDSRAKADSLQIEHVRRLRAILNDWLDGQARLNHLLGKGEKLQRAELIARAKEGLEKAPPSQMTLGGSALNEASVHSAPGVGFLMSLLMSPRPLAMTEMSGTNGLVIRPPAAADASVWTWSDLFRLNLMRTGGSALFWAYSMDRKRAASALGITQDEAQAIFVDAKDLGRALGFVDPRSAEAGRRTFMEASLFGSDSSSDELMTIQEGLEWFYTIETGGHLADRLHRELAKRCAVAEIDVLGRTKLEAKCFRTGLREQMGSVLAFAPGLETEWSRANSEAQSEFIRLIEETARGRGAVDEPVDSSELRGMVPVLLYVESLFSRFDRNQSGVLEEAEIWRAFPVISPFLKPMIGPGTGDFTAQTVFSYLLVFGEPPGQFGAVSWMLGQHFVDESVRRLDLLRLMASLSRHGRRQKNQALKAVLAEMARPSRGATTQPRRNFSPSAERIEQLRKLLHCPSQVAADFEGALSKRLAAGDSLIQYQSRGRTIAPDQDRAVAWLKRLVDETPRLASSCQPF